MSCLARTRITTAHARPATTFQQRLYSSTSPTPPLLQKLKTDLKAAMRAKDAPRLSIIRGILSATNNASKTASPITTDAQLVGLLRKTRAASEEAAVEFRAAGRQDLVDREDAQMAVVDEYVAGSGVEELSEDALRTVVAGVVTAMTSEPAVEGGKAKMGDVMKELLAPGGPLDGKSVEKAELAKVVKQVIG
ncbi:hypothetical protein UCREL1_3323 [Eutypa lata UCREL1]|uniref:Altered inheritance of mitochondria protein 41 n=1 Tax=Eutypa lata (strain UCR-EL1) TaxID=1287681 RepID=M7ST28_EUTLA|nr:hypothetical protein UCREL1_3323 [Eutypa lata UCREL1]